MGTPFREVNASHGPSRPIVWAVPAALNVAIGVALLRDSDRWYDFATVMRWCGSWLTWTASGPPTRGSRMGQPM